MAKKAPTANQEAASVVVTVRLDAETYAAVKAVADAERRPVSALLRNDAEDKYGK